MWFIKMVYPLTVIMTTQAHTPAPHRGGPLPQSVKPLVTGNPSDAAAHASYPPRIKFLHQTVTE